MENGKPPEGRLPPLNPHPGPGSSPQTANPPRARMATKPQKDEENGYIEGHQDRIAGRGLGYLILLNGFAAIVMIGAFVYGFQTSAEPKLAAAMVVFGVGAVAGLFSSFLAYLN